MFERCTSTTRDGEELRRVVDRPRVVAPRARVHDDAVRPVERVVTPVDELPFVVRLAAPDRAPDLVRPLVDLRLELGKRHPAVRRGVASVERIEVDAVQDDDSHGATLRDQVVESRAHVVAPEARRSSAASPARRGERAAASRATPFLSLASAAHACSRSTLTGSGRRTSDDERCLLVEAREPQGRKQAKRDRLSVWQLKARRSLERVRERVPEVELGALAAVARIAQADAGLERRAASNLLARGRAPRRLRP